MFYRYLFLILLLNVGCSGRRLITLPPQPTNAPSGIAFYRQVTPLSLDDREDVALHQILDGNIPQFLRRFVPIHTRMTDSAGHTVRATYWVMPDYLSVGGNRDFARLPLTPMTAQQIADSLRCFLPTRKMVDDIYRQARVRPEPVPMYIYRDSALMFLNHHYIIEGQRQNRKGLIAGIKKDVVLSGKISRAGKTDRVAIYGWHRTNGQPIQPLYTGHVNRYVDYSHGIRLVYRKVRVNRRWMDYLDVLQHPVYRALLCDEEWCDFFRYGE